MKLIKSDLLPAVRFLSAITVKRSALLISNSLLIEAKGGRMVLRATDGDQDALCFIPCAEDMPAFCVRAKQFFNLVQSAGEVINLVLMNDKRLTFESSFTAILATSDAAEFPARLGGDGVAQGCSTSDLADGIERTVWAKSNDLERPELAGVHVILGPHSIICECCDGRQMGRYLKPSISGKCEFMVMAAFASQMIDSLRQPESNLFISQNCFTVKHAHGEYSAKLSDRPYPNTKQIVDSEKTLAGELDVKATIDHVSLCLSLTDAAWLKLRLSFNFTGLDISCAEGASEYQGSVAGDFEAMEIMADAHRLLIALRSLKADKAKVFRNANRMIVFSVGDYEALTCEIIS